MLYALKTSENVGVSRNNNIEHITLAPRIFLVFCMKLGHYKGRKVTELHFWNQILDLEIFVKKSRICHKIIPISHNDRWVWCLVVFNSTVQSMLDFKEVCSTDVRVFNLRRRSNRLWVFYGKRLPVTVGFERHHKQYRCHHRFIRRKYRIWIKNGNIHPDTWAIFYRSFYVYSIHIMQYPKKLEGSLMFLQKVSFGNWRWKKKHRRGFLSKVEKAAIWIWSYILNLQHFHIFLTRSFLCVVLHTLLKFKSLQCIFSILEVIICKTDCKHGLYSPLVLLLLLLVHGAL